MSTSTLNVVTGAFGYTGKYIARRLIAMGQEVRTLTGHPERPNPFGDRLSVARLDFDHPRELCRSLQGATTLYNTYWVRFTHGRVSYEQAVEHTKTLIRAAEEAGVRRIVQISVSNASEASPLPYFRGKGLQEKAIVASGLSYAILRPTLIFGVGDILINNIAWLLRRCPIFAVPGSGDYRLQPISAEEVAAMAVTAAHDASNVVMDAAGTEVYTFDELVRLIAGKIGRRVRIVHLPPDLALALARVMGCAVRDVVLTRGEVEGLMANLLTSAEPPRGTVRLSDWLGREDGRIGTHYASELSRHYRREAQIEVSHG
jgi:NADH dehydrogenase